MSSVPTKPSEYNPDLMTVAELLTTDADELPSGSQVLGKCVIHYGNSVFYAIACMTPDGRRVAVYHEKTTKTFRTVAF